MSSADKVILPTSYFPPISYMAFLAQREEIFIEQMETYPKQTYRNRCEIMTSSGKLSLIVPISKPNGNHTLTKDIEISYREPWQQHQWKSIQTAYRSSPYFNYYADILQPLFSLEERSLISLNNKILQSFYQIIGIQPIIEFTDDYIKEVQGHYDLRLKMKPGKLPESNMAEYPQVFSHISGFMKDLSVLDLLFNLGPEAKNYLISVYLPICSLSTKVSSKIL
jgi:hypothetical protein